MLLETIAKGGNAQIIRNAIWTMSNCMRGKPRPPVEVGIAALPVIARIFHLDDNEAIADAAYVALLCARVWCSRRTPSSAGARASALLTPPRRRLSAKCRWSLSYISDGENDRIQAVVDSVCAASIE